MAGSLQVLINDIPEVPDQYLFNVLLKIQEENKIVFLNKLKHSTISSNPKPNIHSPLEIYNNENEEAKDPRMKLRVRKEEKIEKEIKIEAHKPPKKVENY